MKMAIINCPECNGQISDTAKKCVHCGYEFKICPECKTILQANVSKCTSCGYQMDSEAPKEKPEHKDLSLISVIHKCESEQILIKNGLKGILAMVLSLAIALIIFLGISAVINWATSDPESILMEYKDTLSTIKTYIILSSILFCITTIVPYALDFYKAHYIKKWCTINRVDLRSLIKDDISRVLPALNADGIVQQLTFTTFPSIRGERYSSSPYTISKERGYIAISFVFNALVATLFAMFVFSNVELYMEKILWVGNIKEIKFGIDDIEKWWMIILAIICYFISSFIDTKYNNTVKELNKAWIAKSLQECNDTYQKCINKLPKQLRKMF